MVHDFERTLSRRGFLTLGLLLFPTLQSTQSRSTRVEFLSYDQVEPLLASGQIVLPPDLLRLNKQERRAAWPRWIQNRDREIRSRLLRGEEDTLVNFVLFGLSFTDQPRVSADDTSEVTARLINARVEHFVAAMAQPDSNERLLLLKKLITGLGYAAASADQKERLTQYVLGSVSRYRAEQQQYRGAVDRSLANDTRSSSSATAQLYKDRGLSIDTDFRPNYAIERALVEVKRRGLLKSVRRAAIIGPGLDFTDKDSGFDHYPLQTLQPFALIDSLLRLDLARTPDLRVGVFDISTQTLDHVSQAVARARSRQAYTLQLVLDRNRPWNPGVLDYWRSLGDHVGSPAEPLPVPSQIRNVDRRAFRVRPETVSALEPQSLNVVAQHVSAPADRRYDLIVATNIFLYYDRFEQALALLNIESMLAPGGILLSNDLSEDYPAVKLRSVGNVVVDYSPVQADQVRIYSIPTFQPQLAPA